MQYSQNSYSLLKFGNGQTKAICSCSMVTDVLVLSEPDCLPQAHSWETDVIHLGKSLWLSRGGAKIWSLLPIGDYCIAGGATPPCAPASPRPWWWCQCSIIVSSFIFKWSVEIPLRSHLMASLLLNWQIELELGWKFFFRIQPDQVFSHNMCSLSILIIRNSSKSGSATCQKSRLFLSGSWRESAPEVKVVCIYCGR